MHSSTQFTTVLQCSKYFKGLRMGSETNRIHILPLLPTSTPPIYIDKIIIKSHGAEKLFQ